MSKIKYPYEFDPTKRRLAKDYRTGRLLLYLIGSMVSLLTIFAILYTDMHIALRDFSLQFPLSLIIYSLSLLLIFTIIGLPLGFYSTYVYERKFNLSRYTLSGWFIDFLKAALISYVITLIVVTLLYAIIWNFTSMWWLYAGIASVIFSTVMNYVYPVFIVPFLWKVHPYKDGTMKAKILNLCRKLGATDIKNVVIINESEKSVRPNAVFMGLGNTKSIGLFDNLINNFTRDELETVVGHELGHYLNKDIIRGLILESILVFPILLFTDYVVATFGPSLGITSITGIASLPLIMLSYGILGFLSMPISNTYSRWREAEADRFALDHIKKPRVQVSTEKRLADISLSELQPHPFIEFWLHTHPAVHRRIQMAEQWRKKNS